MMQPPRLLDVAERVLDAALALKDPAQVVVRSRLQGVVANLASQLDSGSQVGNGIGIRAEPDPAASQVTMGLSLPGPVAELLGRGQRRGLGSRQLMPVPVPVQRRRYRPGQLPGMHAE